MRTTSVSATYDAMLGMRARYGCRRRTQRVSSRARSVRPDGTTRTPPALQPPRTTTAPAGTSLDNRAPPMKAFTSITLAMLIAGHTVSGQVGTKKSLTLDGARRVIASAQAEARKLAAPGGVVAVVDEGGNLMALE